MTYSIVARCRRTGQLGVSSATFSLACGARNESARPGIGVSKSQAYPKRINDLIALHLMEQGMAPAGIMDVLAENDPDFAYRQIGMIDARGRIGMHTGPKSRPWAGHSIGEHCVAFGNILSGEAVPAAIRAGFERDEEKTLAERLVAALEGGRDAGGQANGKGGTLIERSAWVRVIDEDAVPLVDLRVDRSRTAIAELRRIFTEFSREP